MMTRYIYAVGIAGMAALATWWATHRRNQSVLEAEDDRAADIIRRFAPALHAAWAASHRTVGV